MPSEIYRCNLCGKVYEAFSKAEKCEASHLVFELRSKNRRFDVTCSDYDSGESFPKNITVHSFENGEIYAEYYLDREER